MKMSDKVEEERGGEDEEAATATARPVLHLATSLTRRELHRQMITIVLTMIAGIVVLQRKRKQL